MKNILLTGGAGFIGSNFSIYFLEKYPEYHLVILDKLTYAGKKDNLKEILTDKRCTFIQGDICDRELLNNLFKQYAFQGIIHFAAESHVDNSISSPEAFIDTNIKGTFYLLEAARQHWLDGPQQTKTEFKSARFHHISTDEVYGSLGETGLFTESSPYAPNSPYSASKASSDMLVRSYFHTYGLNVVTSNCSNNFGPKQHDEKLIPTVIKNALSGKAIPIYGDGKNRRDWLYVSDHCKALDLVFHKGISGETYNVGGGNEKTNLEIVHEILTILDLHHPNKDGSSYKKLVTFVKDRFGHDFRYAIDASKIARELGWEAEENFQKAILKTINYYL